MPRKHVDPSDADTGMRAEKAGRRDEPSMSVVLRVQAELARTYNANVEDAKAHGWVHQSTLGVFASVWRNGTRWFLITHDAVTEVSNG